MVKERDSAKGQDKALKESLVLKNRLKQADEAIKSFKRQLNQQEEKIITQNVAHTKQMKEINEELKNKDISLRNKEQELQILKKNAANSEVHITPEKYAALKAEMATLIADLQNFKESAAITMSDQFESMKKNANTVLVAEVDRVNLVIKNLQSYYVLLIYILYCN